MASLKYSMLLEQIKILYRIVDYEIDFIGNSLGLEAPEVMLLGREKANSYPLDAFIIKDGEVSSHSDDFSSMLNVFSLCGI